MQNIVQLVKLSSKEAFYQLRDWWEIYCKSLDRNCAITKIFYKHISWERKNRKIKEVVKRLSAISLIKKILNEWELIEERWENKVDWKFFQKFFRLELKIEDINFFVVIWEKINQRLTLISVFVKFENN